MQRGSEGDACPLTLKEPCEPCSVYDCHLNNTQFHIYQEGEYTTLRVEIVISERETNQTGSAMREAARGP